MKKFLLLLLSVALLFVAFKPKPIFRVNGTITNDLGAAISGATVTEKGTKNSVTSNATGYYSIKLKNSNSTLVVTAQGYEGANISVKNSTEINITLKAISASTKGVLAREIERSKKGRDVVYSGTRLSDRLNGKVSVFGINRNAANNNFNTEDYDAISENEFHVAAREPLSTFSIDVDAASYSNVRRFINEGSLPPAGAVRTEEMINYFTYSYKKPMGTEPFSITTELSVSPWNSAHRLLSIGLQAKKISAENLPPSNLVFLIDVSGSMNSENKLPLVKSSLKLLVDQLRAQDKIAIVVYAGSAGLVLPPTSGNEKIKIKTAINNLESGGATAGGEGITLAYKIGNQNLLKRGNNRIILCTDGDFNVGLSSDDALERLVEKEREGGLFLTVLGFGTGNYKDNKMQKLADKGNGNHAYIDGLSEAKKVLVNEFGGTLFNIAKDVKLQVEFNPAAVAGYRLIGYENRMLKNQDFNDDKKDAGELGSGHSVTALYEIIPAGVKSVFLKETDSLKYSALAQTVVAAGKNELMTIKVRYKAPESDKSNLFVQAVKNEPVALASTSNDFRFAASVAGFGLLLRDSEFKGASTYNSVLSLASGALGKDEEGYKKEFVELVKKASVLSKEKIDDVVSRGGND